MSSHIKQFWDEQAKKHGTSHEASWGDNWALDLEINTISKFIKDGDKVLDVGCANGYSALQQCEKHKVELVGVDYSKEMIEQAIFNLEHFTSNNRNVPGTIGFRVCDIRNIDFQDNYFDVTYTTRCLINLPTWEEQMQGIKECIRVTKPGGKIILSEAFYEPLVLLNAMRQLVGLTPLVEHDFNRYIKKERLEDFLDMRFDKTFKWNCIDFSSVYYLGSRFLRELVDQEFYKTEGYSHPVNKAFHELSSKFQGGGFGIQQAYVITK